MSTQSIVIDVLGAGKFTAMVSQFGYSLLVDTAVETSNCSWYNLIILTGHTNRSIDTLQGI